MSQTLNQLKQKSQALKLDFFYLLSQTFETYYLLLQTILLPIHTNNKFFVGFCTSHVF
ncbi:MAG: hypothetical protein RJA07_964 [Bacteroidota bacterium]|jgi:hypothetical protein